MLVYIREKGEVNMKKTGNDQKNRSKESKDIRLEDVDSDMKIMSTLLGELQSKINILPKVDENGRSECPFAEDLYFEKEKAAKKVSEYLEKMHRYVGLVEQEIVRFHNNIATIRADANSLFLIQAKENYKQAEESQIFHIKKTTDQKKDLLDLISRAEKMLQLARGEKWPGEKPEKRFCPPAMTGGQAGLGNSGFQGQTPVESFPSRSPIKNEVDNLMSLAGQKRSSILTKPLIR